MGFVEPLALLALPLALLPILLRWRGRRRGAPERFSSLHLFDEARRRPRTRSRRSRRAILLRVLALALLVLAAARPVGPGRGDPAAHRPTAAVVAVDVSASVGQRGPGGTAWSSLQAWADSILALGTADDRIALAAVADGIVGWWTGPPTTLRRRLATLEPTDRASDWPRVLAGLDARLENGTEAYLLTDGAVGARGPVARRRARPPVGRRVLRLWPADPGANRSLALARWASGDRVALGARGWGSGGSVVAGRLQAEALVDSAPIPLDGGVGATTWTVADTATFALAGADRLTADDRLYVSLGREGAYRIARVATPEEPPESGALFWEAALASSTRTPTVERVRGPGGLAGRPPDLVLLPLRGYRPDEAAALADLSARGARLLFVPLCPEAACVPGAGWLPGAEVPAVGWGLGDGDRRTALTGLSAIEGPGIPEHLLQRAPIRGALATEGGAPPDWTWDLATGEPALWVRGRIALWLVPLGAPVTRLAATPLFPLIADAALAAWDPAWRGIGSLRPGDEAPVPHEGATVSGPLHWPEPTTWTVTDGDRGPRLERRGLYRVDDGRTTFVAVNGDPAEGDLQPVPIEIWEAGWGAGPTSPEDWRDALFPRRRGPELWPWAVVLALAVLIAEARLRRADIDK